MRCLVELVMFSALSLPTLNPLSSFTHQLSPVCYVELSLILFFHLYKAKCWDLMSLIQLWHLVCICTCVCGDGGGRHSKHPNWGKCSYFITKAGLVFNKDMQNQTVCGSCCSCICDLFEVNWSGQGDCCFSLCKNIETTERCLIFKWNILPVPSIWLDWKITGTRSEASC